MQCCCSTEAETGFVPTSAQFFAVGTLLILEVSVLDSFLYPKVSCINVFRSLSCSQSIRQRIRCPTVDSSQCGVKRVWPARFHCFQSGYIASVLNHSHEGQNQFAQNQHGNAIRGTGTGLGLSGIKALVVPQGMFLQLNLVQTTRRGRSTSKRIKTLGPIFCSCSLNPCNFCRTCLWTST